MTIVQNASSDSEIAELRRQVDSLRQEVAALKAQVGQQAYSPRPLEDRVSATERDVDQLQSQVGVNSLNKVGLSNLWDESARLDRCMDRIRSDWQSDYAPFC